MANVMNTNKVSVTMISQGLFFTKSPKSSLTLDFCSGFGMIRSLVVKKVINNMMVPTMAKTVITFSIPMALSPFPALLMMPSVNT